MRLMQMQGGWIPSTIKEGLEYYAQGDLESEELDEIVSALDKLRIRSVNQLAGLTLPKAEAALNKSEMQLGESELVLKLIAGLRGEDPGAAPTEPVAPRPPPSVLPRMMSGRCLARRRIWTSSTKWIPSSWQKSPKSCRRVTCSILQKQLARLFR